ncbi:MAG TPA: CPBP family intramembrane glutamic endopeptidase [Dehalococcoidia bacterium]
MALGQDGGDGAAVPEAPRLREGVPWGARDVLLGTLLAAVLFLLLTLLSLAPAAVLPLSEGEAAAVELAGDLLAPALAMVAAAAVVVRWRGGTAAHLGLRTFPWRRGWLIPAVLALDCVLTAAYFVLAGAAGLLAVPAAEPGPDPALAGVLDGAAGIILAPVAEELFFRGFMFAGLVPRLGIGGAALASALLFSAVHLDGGVLLPFTAGAVLLAYAYRWSGSLWFPILAHAGYNGVVTLALL